METMDRCGLRYSDHGALLRSPLLYRLYRYYTAIHIAKRMQLSSDSVTRNFGCNYLRGAISSDRQYLAALIDEYYIGIFCFHELCSSATSRVGERLESHDNIIFDPKVRRIGVAPIFKIPINATTKSSGSNSAGGSSICDLGSLHDLCWCPGHVSGSRLLATAGSSNICVWMIPMGKDKVIRIQSGRASQDDAEVLKPTLMHSFVVDFPEVVTPQTSSYSSNSPFDTTFCLRTVESSDSAEDLKSKFSGHAPSIKSIEWHLGAVPTLVAFSTTCDPIKIVLPRNGVDLEVTRILSTSRKRVESSDSSSPEVEPGHVNSHQNSSCAVQVGSRSRVIAPRVRVHSFGVASLKSKMVIAVDSIGSLIVLFDSMNGGLKLREPSSYLESERNKRVKAVCLSGDDSVACIAYSVSSSLAHTAKTLAPCRGLLSIENLHEAISATQHGSSLRSSRGFRHILAGTSLRDAIDVPVRTDSATASTATEASSCPTVCPTEASSCPAVCLNEATHRTRYPAANLAEYSAISQSTLAKDESNATEYLRFDSSSVSVMDSLLFINNRARSTDGEAVEGSSSSSFLNRHSLTDSETKSKKQLPLNALSSATGSNDFGSYHTPASFDIFGEVEVKWLREPGAAPCSTDGDNFQNGKPIAQCNESKNENLKVTSTGEKLMRVPIMDPLLAHPDILFYREHIQPLPSKLLSSPEAAADQSPLLMGHLAVGSTQSGRVLIYALQATPTGHSATIHHTFDLPGNQKTRGIYLPDAGDLLCVYSALKSACAPSLASCSTTSHCATFFTTTSLSLSSPLQAEGPNAESKAEVEVVDLLPFPTPTTASSDPQHEPATTSYMTYDYQGLGASSAATTGNESSVEDHSRTHTRGPSSRGACMEAACSDADISLLDRVLKMQIAITDRLGSIEQSLVEQEDSMKSLHSKLDMLLGRNNHEIKPS